MKLCFLLVVGRQNVAPVSLAFGGRDGGGVGVGSRLVHPAKGWPTWEDGGKRCSRETGRLSLPSCPQLQARRTRPSVHASLLRFKPRSSAGTAQVL